MEIDLGSGKPTREVLRAWCGVDNVERFDELVELRKEIRRVGEAAERAIAALRSHGHDVNAAQSEQELGTPVEMLRTELPDSRIQRERSSSGGNRAVMPRGIKRSRSVRSSVCV